MMEIRIRMNLNELNSRSKRPSWNIGRMNEDGSISKENCGLRTCGMYGSINEESIYTDVFKLDRVVLQAIRKLSLLLSLSIRAYT